MDPTPIQFNSADPLRWKEMVLADGRTEEAKLEAVGTEFQSVLLRQFLTEALKPMSEDGDVFGGGNSVYGYFITDTLANSLSKSDVFGYSSLIQAQLAARQSAANSLPDDNLQ